MLPGMRGFDHGERLKKLKLMTLEKRRNCSNLVELFRISKGLSAIPWERFSVRTTQNEQEAGHQ